MKKEKIDGYKLLTIVAFAIAAIEGVHILINLIFR